MSKRELVLLFHQVLRILYGQNFQRKPDLETLGKVFETNLEITPDDEDFAVLPDENVREMAFSIASGVYENQVSLDASIRKYLRGWRLERLGLMELLLLRSGLYAIGFEKFNPKSVIHAIKNVAEGYGLERAENFIAAVLQAYASEREIEKKGE